MTAEEARQPATPLAGLLVVALEQAVAAPYLTSRLADAGARVIKIERAEGDFARGYDDIVLGESAYFVWINRGKESIALDIKTEEDARLLHRMIAKADVFVQNLAPGAAARAGFGSRDLRAAHPRLITCDISGYGEDGDYADMKAYDLLVQAESGLASITGDPHGPGRVGVSVCDVAAGMHGLIGILEALYERQRTGRGKGVKVSLFGGMADWMSVPLMQLEHGGKAPERVGLNHPSIAPYGAYRTADGAVVVSIQNEREWAAFCRGVLQKPELAEDPDFAGNSARQRNRARLDAEIDAVLSGLSREVVIERLRAARVAYGSLNSVGDFSRHPQLRRTPQPLPAGTAQAVASPIRFDGEGTPFRPVPRLDEHGAALRAEFAED